MVPIIRKHEIFGEMVAVAAASEFSPVDMIIKDSEICYPRQRRDEVPEPLPLARQQTDRGENERHATDNARLVHFVEEAIVRLSYLGDHLFVVTLASNGRLQSTLST